MSTRAGARLIAQDHADAGSVQGRPPAHSFAHLPAPPECEAPIQLRTPTPDPGSLLSRDLLERTGAEGPLEGPRGKGGTEAKTSEPTEAASSEQTLEKARWAAASVEAAIRRCEDTVELAAALEEIKIRFELDEIRMVNLGSPKAAVEYLINPWFSNPIGPGKVIWKMVGTGLPKPITQVTWLQESMTIGTESAPVGKEMRAEPLGPDHEPGSTSSADSEQNALMGQLANAGNTKVPNDQKYIKGHLLNDHVGGPGAARNLFPITADANAKHLAYVEKWVKAQLKSSYVISYSVRVNHSPPVALNGDGQAPFGIDSDFSFTWNLLDTSGLPTKAVHGGTIESRYNTKGIEPFDVDMEYALEYDKVNKGKSTPTAIGQTGQWQVPTISQPPMISKIMPATLDPSLSMPTSTPAPLDYTGLGIKKDSSGVEYVSVRNADAPDPSAVGTSIRVGVSSSPRDESIKSISPLGGGWTRIYF